MGGPNRVDRTPASNPEVEIDTWFESCQGQERITKQGTGKVWKTPEVYKSRDTKGEGGSPGHPEGKGALSCSEIIFWIVSCCAISRKLKMSL